MKIRKFYRYNLCKVNNLGQSVDENTLQADIEVISNLRLGDGIILARWNESRKNGEVKYIGIVAGEINQKLLSIPVIWFEKSFVLSPNGGGYQFWRKDFFKFADAPAKRYKLQNYFDELDSRSVMG